MSRHVHAAHTADGFTLIEMVVVMALLGMLMLGLGSGFGFFLRYAGIGERTTVDAADMSRAEDMLRRQVEGSLWMPMGTPDGRAAPLAFEGSAESLQFLVAAPAYPTRSGVYLVAFDVVEGADGQTLRFSRALFDRSGGPWGIGAGVPRAALATVPGVFRFSYFDGSEWTETWANRPALPQLVRLRVSDGATGRLLWPEITMRPSSEADPSCPDPARFALCRRAS